MILVAVVPDVGVRLLEVPAKAIAAGHDAGVTDRERPAAAIVPPQNRRIVNGAPDPEEDVVSVIATLHITDHLDVALVPRGRIGQVGDPTVPMNLLRVEVDDGPVLPHNGATHASA